mmetsp:Transcript_39432/g.89657  ORF Transcript_39432/g.89657 Transcript_39432/m.89657 type:complete len:240 (+) Transcript_39432:255-974(+)
MRVDADRFAILVQRRLWPCTNAEAHRDRRLEDVLHNNSIADLSDVLHLAPSAIPRCSGGLAHLGRDSHILHKVADIAGNAGAQPGTAEVHCGGRLRTREHAGWPSHGAARLRLRRSAILGVHVVDQEGLVPHQVVETRSPNVLVGHALPDVDILLHRMAGHLRATYDDDPILTVVDAACRWALTHRRSGWMEVAQLACPSECLAEGELPIQSGCTCMIEARIPGRETALPTGSYRSHTP